MARRLSRWMLLVCTLALVGCDHATKLAASSTLRGRTVSVIPGLFDLVYAENRDLAFSLFRQVALPARPTLLLVLSAVGVTVVALAWWRRRTSGALLERLGWALTLAGAIGNCLDRLVRGYVVDFIHVHHWPVFNVADVAVVLGIAALLLGTRAPSRAAAA